MSETAAARVWAAMQIFCVACWCSVWTTEVRPSFGIPIWLQAACNLAMFVWVSRSVWRGTK